MRIRQIPNRSKMSADVAHLSRDLADSAGARQAIYSVDVGPLSVRWGAIVMLPHLLTRTLGEIPEDKRESGGPASTTRRVFGRRYQGVSTQVITAVEAYERVRESATKTQEVAQVREVGLMSVGDSLRQGDLYVVFIGDGTNVDEKIFKRLERVRLQLADGDTQGSRHILSSPEGVVSYDIEQPREVINLLKRAGIQVQEPVYFGPAFTLDRKTTLTHPEHGDRVLGPGMYVSIFQRVYRNEIQRVVD